MKKYLLLLVIFPLLLNAQQFADKDYYLTDSLDLESLSESDRSIIDSCLNIFHKSKVDTTKISAIIFIANHCYNERVWVKYNLWAKGFCENKIKASGVNLSFFKRTYSITLNNIGLLLQSKGEVEKALQYYNESLEIQEVLKSEEGEAMALNNLGTLYEHLGYINKALENYYKSLEINLNLKDKKRSIIILNNIAVIYREQGKIKKALETCHQALKLNKGFIYKESAANSLQVLGAIYFSLKNNTEAINYFTKALEIFIQLGDKRGISEIYNNIAATYENKGELNNALKYFNKSLAVDSLLENKRGIASTLNNIAKIYNNIEKVDKSIKYSKKSIEFNKNLIFKEEYAVSLNNLGESYYKKKKLNIAKKHFSQSFLLSNELGFIKNISDNSKYLSIIAALHNDYKEAYEMYALHIKLRDSINNIDTQKAAIEQKAKYNYETQKAIDDAESDKLIAIEKQEKEKQKVITTATIGGLVLLVIFLAFVFNRLRKSKRQQKIISEQKEVVELAHKQTEQQKEIIEETHKEITDSINYAKRLQNAILPSSSEINAQLENNFILFEPKDVVSGDFYWFEHKETSNNKAISFLAAADCTGHGVPGAMVSVVCSNALHRTVNEFNITSPSKILDKTRELVIATFAKSGEEVKDGMDIALCAFSNNNLTFSGANNPLWIVRERKLLTTEQIENRATVVEGELALIEYKANKQPVGLYSGMTPFTQTEITLEKEDMLYFFTDGFADQFGGEKGKKFKYRPFKKLLIEVSKNSMETQKEIISKHFKDWKGELEQVDDVCIIGVKINTT